jgi:hypothetical protein
MNMSQFELLWHALLKALLYFKGNWLALVAVILSLISLWITWHKNIKDRRYANDKDLVEQLKQSLELPYKSLALRDDSERPTNIRLRWLAAARHIARYRELQSSLKTSLHKTICEEQEEYWRDKVYGLLQHIDDSRFFEPIDPEKFEKDKIDLRSAAVVFSFSVWKEGRPDPLDNMTLEEIIQNYKLFSPIHMHFWDYVQRTAPEITKKIKRTNS